MTCMTGSSRLSLINLDAKAIIGRKACLKTM